MITFKFQIKIVLEEQKGKNSFKIIKNIENIIIPYAFKFYPCDHGPKSSTTSKEKKHGNCN